MIVIKRYPNRKLYDTDAKEYITLDGIAHLIRQGADVEIVDHATGEDLTALTLSQIIFEQQKKHRGFLPHSVLTGLIQAGGDTFSTLRRTLVDSLGISRLVDEEIERRIHTLMHSGDLTRQEVDKLLPKLLVADRRPGHPRKIDEEMLAQLLTQRGLPTRDDLQSVVEQLSDLEAKLEDIRRASPGT
jgi:polyhydroxyalkanoate synthesis repressor PhaR